jgi:hypothetical protein
LSKKALQKVVTARAEIQKDETGKLTLQEQLEAAKKAARAAAKAVADGQLTNWGQNPLPTPAKVKAAAAASSDLKKADEEADAGKTAAEMKPTDYENMTEDQIQYWLAKEVKYPDSEKQSSEKVMGRVFAAKEDEAEQIRSIKALKKAAEAKLSSPDQAALQAGIPMIKDGMVLNPEKERQMMAKKDPDTENISPGQLPSEAEDEEDKTKAMSNTEFEGKVKDIKEVSKEEIENAIKVAKNAGKMLAPKKSKKVVVGTDTEVHQIAQAHALKAEAKAEAATAKADPKQDMGEGLDDESEEDSFDNEEISADRAEEAGKVRDVEEGIDEANADVEMDDAGVEDEEDGDDAEDDDA